MKNIFILVISLLVLSSCGSDTANNDSDKSTNEDKVVIENAKPDGDQVVSTYTNGNPKITRTFKVEGEKRTAVYEKENYEDGNLLKEGGLKNGKRDGEWKSFRRDGILWSEGYYVDGVRNGTTITYHPNGKKYYEGHYTNGSKSGNWKFYDRDGNMVKEENYDKK